MYVSIWPAALVRCLPLIKYASYRYRQGITLDCDVWRVGIEGGRQVGTIRIRRRGGGRRAHNVLIPNPDLTAEIEKVRNVLDLGLARVVIAFGDHSNISNRTVTVPGID